MHPVSFVMCMFSTICFSSIGRPEAILTALAVKSSSIECSKCRVPG